MKIICEKRREINTAESCRKEFCCKRLKEAFEHKDKKYRTYYSNFRVHENTVLLDTHHDYDGSCQEETINYCPFCGAKLTVEHVEIDNTGLPPSPEKELVSEKVRRGVWWKR